MAYTLDAFSAECHRLLKAEPGPEGRQKVCAYLQDVLQDEAFVATHLGDDVPERKIIYEDAELGFCILAHVNHGAKESPPHDHGPTWAIYGQAAGETEMTDWEVVEPNDLINIFDQSITSLIRTQGLGDLNTIYLLSQRDQNDYHLTYIPNDFKMEPKEPFDTKYMQALFSLGYDLAKSGNSWKKAPPGFQSIESDREGIQ